MAVMTEEWIGMEDICFATGKIITKGDRCRWTDEFDAWVSEEGQKQIEKRARSSKIYGTSDDEARIIFAEWYAKDEAAAGREQYGGWYGR